MEPHRRAVQHGVQTHFPEPRKLEKPLGKHVKKGEAGYDAKIFTAGPGNCPNAHHFQRPHSPFWALRPVNSTHNL